MRLKQSRFILLGISIVAAASTFSLISDAQSIPSNHVAVSNEEGQHIHSFALRAQDVVDALANLTEEQTITFFSSTGYDEGIVNGVAHSHQINLTKSQFQQLQNNGTLSVVSEINLDHQHTFTFLNQPACMQVMPSPSPSVSPSPSPAMSPSPQPSPSVEPSPSPSVYVTPVL